MRKRQSWKPTERAAKDSIGKISKPQKPRLNAGFLLLMGRGKARQYKLARGIEMEMGKKALAGLAMAAGLALAMSENAQAAESLDSLQSIQSPQSMDFAETIELAQATIRKSQSAGSEEEGGQSAPVQAIAVPVKPAPEEKAIERAQPVQVQHAQPIIQQEKAAEAPTPAQEAQKDVPATESQKASESKDPVAKEQKAAPAPRQAKSVFEEEKAELLAQKKALVKVRADAIACLREAQKIEAAALCERNERSATMDALGKKPQALSQGLGR